MVEQMAAQRHGVSSATERICHLWHELTVVTTLLVLAGGCITLQAKLWSSEHWVLSLSCHPQPADAGAGQGIFVAVANQPLLRLQFDKWSLQHAAAKER